MGSQKECVLSSCLDPTELDDAVHVCSNGRAGVGITAVFGISTCWWVGCAFYVSVAKMPFSGCGESWLSQPFRRSHIPNKKSVC